MRGRLALGVTGLLIGAWGGWLLVDPLEWAALVEVAAWFAVGLVLHDLVLVPLVLALGWSATRWLPWVLRGPVAVGVLVLGTVTLAAVPVLGRFGALADNPTLLDRDYTAGWLALTAGVTAGVVAATLVRLRRGVIRSNRRSG